MFQSESCAVADQDVNEETIKMQITGWEALGNEAFCQDTLINSTCNPTAACCLPAEPEQLL